MRYLFFYTWQTAISNDHHQWSDGHGHKLFRFHSHNGSLLALDFKWRIARQIEILDLFPSNGQACFRQQPKQEEVTAASG